MDRSNDLPFVYIKMSLQTRTLAARFDFMANVTPGESAECIERIVFLLDAAILQMAIQKIVWGAAIASDFDDASWEIARLIEAIA